MSILFLIDGESESSGNNVVIVQQIKAQVMERIRIMIVSEDHSFSLSLCAMLQNLGHIVVACARSAADAIANAPKLSPELVFMDIPMDHRNGLQASKRFLEQHALPIVLMTSVIEPELIDQADAIGVSGYMSKPVLLKDIQPALVLARSRFRQLQSLKQEIVDLQNMLRSRKLIEQAKGLLMEREGIPEAEAFRRIQCMSRNQNIPMAALSEAIIMTNKVMNKPKANKDRLRENRGAVQDRFQD